MSRLGARRRTIAAMLGAGAAIAGSAGLALADPAADFAVSSERPAPGESVTFTAQAACAAPVTCTWDFGEGRDASGREVSHAFAESGPHRVTLTVSDPDDPADPSVAAAIVRVDARPTAAFSVSPANPRKNDTVTFDGRDSSDPDGDALTYRWDFDGNGTQDGDGPEITHPYPAAGTYEATLTVDDGRLSHAVFRTVVVASAPPVASITPSAATPLTAQSVTFTATATDPDGAIAAWAWDLDDDGSFDDGTGPSASTAFPLPGPRPVRVRVTDEDGQTAVGAATVTVLNRDPVAAFSFSPDPVPQETPVTFTSQATDPEDRLASLEWDLDGDGAYDDATGATATATFSSAAPRTIGLRVTDEDGGAAERRSEILPGNQTPDVGFTISPESPLSGEAVAFNATAQDPDGAIAGYEWDLDGDGAFDDATGGVATSSYAIPGSRTVRLRVTDDEGASATAQRTFTVLNRPPVAAFEVPVVLRNEPAVFTSTSSDPEGRLSSVAWDLDGDGAFDDGDTPSVTRIFSTSATVTVSLHVADADGGQDTFTADLIPGNHSPTASFSQSPARVLTGEPVRFTSSASDADGAIASLEWDLGAGFAVGAAEIETSYAVPGQYPVRLRATDNDGASATGEQTIFVGNRPPVAQFSYSPALVVKGRPVTFTSQSSDPEGRLAALEWDLNGDGAFDDAAGETAARAFTASGPTSVGLRATDRDGGEDVFRLSLVPGNKAPSAGFTVAPAAAGLGATFTATAADEDGAVARVEWDFDDDGAFDDGSGAVAFWTFPAPGTYRVSVRVTDDDRSSSIASRRVTIAGGSAAGGGAGGGGGGGGGGAVATPTAPGRTPRAPAARRARLLSPWPVIRIAGSLTKRGARLRLLSVKAPRGSRVAANCRGRSCARKAVRRRAGRRTLRLRAFERSLRAGTVLEIRVLSRTRIGKYTRFKIRKGKAPARRDRCVWPGKRKPRACPS
jgi:PKD repeat protein